MRIYENAGILLYPKGFHTVAYENVLRSVRIWTGYHNTVFYVLCGGTLSVFITIITAFSLTRKGLPGKNIFLFLIMFTMYFPGGLIPMYLVVKGLGMLDTVFAMIIPGAISVYNLMVTISYFRSLPDAMEEAAKIDGANEFTVLFRIMIPLAKPIIAVISLYYMVAIWNDYFSALVYLNDWKRFPLQMVLREILIQDNIRDLGVVDRTAAYAENLKFAATVVAAVPILSVYPFIQKYFVKGVMIGAIKG